MTVQETAKIVKYIKYAMIACVVAILLLGLLFAWDYAALIRARLVSAREIEVSALIHSHGPLTASDVGLIRPWMTFNYINTLFKVPPDYLKNNLSISDPSYPRLSLSEYAKYQQTNSAVVLSQVEDSLATYLILSASATGTSTPIINSTTTK